ncbi:hypothetical protein [Roseomonas populi]|uniref:Phasin family protein n=1 Tax=Roseomonas populi TaxID=3121582 RepID=A0ABT1XDM3_9PROT|nr:hypothetical protein [Roseomonas pecuniae]MCR0985232.1 hypothetical protein [Roseomonas pecuniae]
MAVDWDGVFSTARQAALARLNSNLPLLLHTVETQTAAMVSNGRFIEENKETMTAEEYEMIQRIQIRATEGVFKAFEGIGIVAAQQAAEAAWEVVAEALRAAAGVAFI